VIGYEIINEPWFGDIYKNKSLIMRLIMTRLYSLNQMLWRISILIWMLFL